MNKTEPHRLALFVKLIPVLFAVFMSIMFVMCQVEHSDLLGRYKELETQHAKLRTDRDRIKNSHDRLLANGQEQTLILTTNTAKDSVRAYMKYLAAATEMRSEVGNLTADFKCSFIAATKGQNSLMRTVLDLDEKDHEFLSVRFDRYSGGDLIDEMKALLDKEYTDETEAKKAMDTAADTAWIR